MLKRAIGSLAAMLLMLPCAAPVAAQQSRIWAEVEGWVIGIDDALGSACYAATMYEGGTHLRLGVDGNHAKLPYFLLISNANWASIEEGKDYEVTLQFDRAPPWDANAYGINSGTLPGLLIVGDSSEFLQEFRRKHGLRVRFGGREILGVKLTGSAKATMAMVQCQLEQGIPGVSPPRDPFANGARTNSNDPFAE